MKSYNPKTPTKPVTKPGTRPSRTSPVPGKEPSVKPRPKANVAFMTIEEIEKAANNRDNLSQAEREHLANSIVHHSETTDTAIRGALLEKNYNLALYLTLAHQKSNDNA